MQFRNRTADAVTVTALTLTLGRIPSSLPVASAPKIKIGTFVVVTFVYQ
jgi:hypothetical protein